MGPTTISRRRFLGITGAAATACTFGLPLVSQARETRKDVQVVLAMQWQGSVVQCGRPTLTALAEYGKIHSGSKCIRQISSRSCKLRGSNPIELSALPPEGMARFKMEGAWNGFSISDATLDLAQKVTADKTPTLGLLLFDARWPEWYGRCELWHAETEKLWKHCQLLESCNASIIIAGLGDGNQFFGTFQSLRGWGKTAGIRFLTWNPEKPQHLVQEVRAELGSLS